MLSLAELLDRHRRILVLDAASATVQAGLLRAGEPAVWRRSEAGAGQAVFELTGAVLDAGALTAADVGAFVYCAGPGSMLGVRTVAMALRTWLVLRPRPVFAYHSLTLLAHHLRRTGATAPFAVIADARRDTWHVVRGDATGGPAFPQRVPTAVLAAADGPALWQPAGFRAWSALPREARPCAYDLAPLFAAEARTPLFAAVDAPDVFQHEAPQYRPWSAQMHSADAARRP